MCFSHYIGVDISKASLDVAIYPAMDKKSDFIHIENSKAQSMTKFNNLL